MAVVPVSRCESRRRSFLAFVALQLLAAASVAGQDEAPHAGPPIDHARAASHFDEARALAAGSPWLGSLDGPLVFVDPATRYAVANRPDSLGVLRATGEVFAGTLPEDVGVANTAVSWAGRRWTMLVWPLPIGYYARRVLLGHELFHRLGPEIGLPSSNPANEHLDTAEGRLSLRLELRALARALATSGEDRRDALADALAFRSRRHAAFPAAAAEERALERNEGLAEYTGIHVALPAGARDGWAVQRIEAREAQADREGLSRSFAYATGPAYGLLLDEAAPGWTRGLDEDVDIAALAASAFSVRPDELLARADARIAAYDGVALERFEHERAAERERRQAAYGARYIEGPVLTLPVDDEFGYTFDPNAVSTLDGVGQVLATGRVQGGWGRLDVSGGVLLRRTERGIVAVVVPAPADPGARPLSGDGWTLALNESWDVMPGERPGDFEIKRLP